MGIIRSQNANHAETRLVTIPCVKSYSIGTGEQLHVAVSRRETVRCCLDRSPLNERTPQRKQFTICLSTRSKAKYSRERFRYDTTAHAGKSVIMTTMRRLSDDDVRAIFESLHEHKRPPSHLRFQIVPVGPNGLKLSPPSFEFEGTHHVVHPSRSLYFDAIEFTKFNCNFLEDGLYVLLQPEKKIQSHGSAAEALRAQSAGRNPMVPEHLKVLVMTEMPPETCPWSLSGPQFPQPTAIQQRYCYPKGDPDYAGRKGGALWTMYGSNGKEDFQFRLLHVYFSAKRAVNKGVELSDEDRMKQRLQNDVASAASVAASAGTPKRKTKRVARAARSPWQERPAAQAHLGKGRSTNHSSSNARSAKRLRRPPLPITTGCTEIDEVLLPPSSPFQNSRSLIESAGSSIYVSPNTAASSSGERAEAFGHPFDSSYFDHPPFHPVASFDVEDENNKAGASMSQKNQYPFRPATSRSPLPGRHRQHSPASLIEKDESFEFNEAAATIIGGHHDTISAWNDPLLPLDGKPSFDESTNEKRDANACDSEPPTPDKLKIRLGRVHEAIRQGILAHPISNQGPLLSIVASWGRSLAQNPLVPTITMADQDLISENPESSKDVPADHRTTFAMAEV